MPLSEIVHSIGILMNIRCYLTTDFSYGTALHEIGHALGLVHEHLSPAFTKNFEWKGTRNELYPKIKAGYSGYSGEPEDVTQEQKARIDHNFFNLKQVDERKSSFDINSVMAYQISDQYISVRANADSSIKKAFAEHKGIPGQREGLSAGDRKFIAQCYGPTINRAKISGSVRVEGSDDEDVCFLGVCVGGDPETTDETYSISERTVVHL